MGHKVIQLTFCLTFLLVTLLAFLPISSFDLGYHLATGRYILEHFEIPSQDMFAVYSPTGVWPLHQGISALLIYLFYLGMGFLGLKICLFLTLLLMSGVLFFGEFTEKTLNGNLKILFSFVAILLVFDRWELRPDLFSAFLLCAMAAVLRRMERQSTRMDLFFVFFFLMIWPSIHAGFIFGVLFFGLWQLGALIGEKKFRFSIFFTGMIGALLGLLAVGVYNPGGLYGLLEPLFFSKDRWFQQHIAEYQAIEVLANRMFLWVMAVSVCFMIPLIRDWRTNLKWIIPSLCFFFFSISIIRMKIYVVPFFFWIWISVTKQVRARDFFLPAFFVNVWVFVTLGLVDVSHHLKSENFDSHEIPERAFRFLQQNEISGNLFNEDAWGGWLSFFLYPKAKVFVDNRLGVYGTEFYKTWYLNTLDAKSPPLEQLKAWKIENVVVRTRLSSPSLQAELLKSLNWKMVYFDDIAMVFSQSQKVVQKDFEGWLLEPERIRNPDDRMKFLLKMDQFLKMSPSVLGYELKSTIWGRSGNMESALYEIDQVLAIDACHMPSLYRKAIMLSANQNENAVAKILAKGLRCRGPNFEFLAEWAKLQFKAGFVLKQRRTLREMHKLWRGRPELHRLEKEMLI